MRTSLLVALASVASGGCAPLGDEPAIAERIGRTTAALTVADAADAGCATSQVLGLSLQIVARGNCIAPGAYVLVPDAPNVTFGQSVLRYLEEPAEHALGVALLSEPSQLMQVNSLLRTVAQQYLLYRWYLAASCGIGLAAMPGSSNHETGLAIDLSPSDAWRPAMEQAGFAWLGASDPVHFDYAGPEAIDHRGVDVLAFQQLWNDNHPEDPIAEDGAYGPETEARLEQAPAEGFATAAGCGDPIAVGPGPAPGPDIAPAAAEPEVAASASCTSAAPSTSADSAWLVASALVALRARRDRSGRRRRR